MNLVDGLEGWPPLAWVAACVAACVPACIAVCVHGRRRVARMAQRLAGMPLPVLPPLPGLELPPREDALEAIAGLAPERADRLRAEGIRTFDDLARGGPARLRAIARTPDARPVGAVDAALWTLQAQLLAHGHLEAFAHLVLLLRDGRVPLEAVCEPIVAWRPRGGAPAGLAQALRRIGVDDVESLARRTDVDALAAAAGVSPGRVAAWIAQARLLEGGDEASWLGLLDPRVVARMDVAPRPYPLAGDYRADLDRRAVALSQAVAREFDVAVARWRESALLLLGRDSNRACRACGWFAAAAATLVLVVLVGIAPAGGRPPPPRAPTDAPGSAQGE